LVAEAVRHVWVFPAFRSQPSAGFGQDLRFFLLVIGRNTVLFLDERGQGDAESITLQGGAQFESVSHRLWAQLPAITAGGHIAPGEPWD